MCKKKPEVEKLRRDGVSLSKDTFSGISLAPSSFLFYWVLGLSCRVRRSLRQDEALTVKTDMKRRADLLPVSTSRSRWTTVDIMWGPSRSRAHIKDIKGNSFVMAFNLEELWKAITKRKAVLACKCYPLTFCSFFQETLSCIGGGKTRQAEESKSSVVEN